MSDPKPPIRVPRPVLLISIGAVVIGFAMMLLGGWLGGVTWDEKTHVLMLKTYFSDGWNVSPDALIAGIPDPAYIWGVYVYGPVGELVAHVFTTMVGIESWGDPITSATAYAGRHLAIGFMALAGVLAVGMTARVILRSWSWALLGAALLAVTPFGLATTCSTSRTSPWQPGIRWRPFG